MPPPSYCSKVSTRSANEHENQNDFENTKSDISNGIDTNSELGGKHDLKSETVGLVKTLLGPSLEDAVLRTLEFGKTLIQKTDGDECVPQNKKLLGLCKKELTENSHHEITLDYLTRKGNKGCQMAELNNTQKGKGGRKWVGVNNKANKNLSLCKKSNSTNKKMGVSKIRSLDSDLKDAPSPEKIKRQLEALIQINRDEPPEHGVCWSYCSKTSKLPMELTVMPSLCMYRNEADLNGSSSCEVQSNTSKHESECDAGTSNLMCSGRRRPPNKICQAPEFLSNALGPTIDVSIIDNLKMMRDLFKCENAKGEEPPKQCPTQTMRQEVQFQSSEADMCSRIEELQKKIEELEEKERCLVKHIEEEERMRECKRKAFEEEKQMVKTCESGAEDLSPVEAKLKSLQARICCEEEKLLRLKAENENYRREVAEAKSKKDALKRNQSLLDAWDVFASRVCHTRLPSFSRVFDLERKQSKNDDRGALHCCFPVATKQSSTESTRAYSGKSCKGHDKHECQCPKPTPSRCGSNSSCKNDSQRAAHCPNHSVTLSASHCATHAANHDKNLCENHGGHYRDVTFGQSSENVSDHHIKCKIKLGEIQFPIQRDIFCGLHQMLKTCSCKHKSMRVEGHICSSEDELFKKYRSMHSGSRQENYYSGLGLDSSAELVKRNDKAVCRSKSETSVKKNKCSRIVKVMWATARINVFQDNCRTYEIMGATSTPPHCIPAKTEGIFVVKTPQKKFGCSSSRRKCHQNIPRA